MEKREIWSRAKRTTSAFYFWVLAWSSAAVLLTSCGGGGGGGGVAFPSASQAAIPASPSGLTYDNDSAVYAVGTEITPNNPRNSGGAIAQYRVTPDLPKGLALGADGVIRGTPTEVTLPKYYVVTGSNAGGSAATRLTIEVRAAPTAPQSLRYVAQSVIYGVGIAVVPNYPYVSGGPATEFSTSPALPAGLRIDPKSGIISGSPTVVTAAGMYTVTAANALGSATSRLQIEVRAFEVAPNELRYTDDTVIYWTGSPIVPNQPMSKGGEIKSFSIWPSLPAGLVLDPVSGIISGAPAAVSAPQVYTIAGSNGMGSVTALVSIEIRAQVVAPTKLKYADTSSAYTVGWSIFPNWPTSEGGKITNYSVSPTLPAGLGLDPQTGWISGTPANLQSPAFYTVTGSNSAGSTAAQVQIGVYQKPDGFWFTSYYMNSARTRHIATALADGRVLITGGVTGSGISSTAGLYDSLGSLWTPTASMNVARLGSAATLLPDGKVLVAGGQRDDTGTQLYTTSAELFDPASQTWSATGSMVIPRRDHTATLLQNGKVLVAGGFTNGYQYTSAELYDPVTRTWSSTGAMTHGRISHTSTLLPDGRVLVTGGNGYASSGYENLSSAEIYDPATGIWSSVGSMSRSRGGHTATLLTNGKVLIVGGGADSDLSSPTELFDPASGTWSVSGSIYRGRTGHTATLLADGKVLVAGGQAPYGGYIDYLSTTSIYDPGTGQWAIADNLSEGRTLHTATLLPNGVVLITGGTAVGKILSSAELYFRY